MDASDPVCLKCGGRDTVAFPPTRAYDFVSVNDVVIYDIPSTERFCRNCHTLLPDRARLIRLDGPAAN